MVQRTDEGVLNANYSSIPLTTVLTHPSSPAKGEEKQHVGFTLIELLVVILIIGILATVALPQYQKAVAKARAVKLVSILRTVEKAMDVSLLSNGYTDVYEKEFDIKPSENLKNWGSFDISYYCAGENPEYPDDPVGCWIMINTRSGDRCDISWENQNYTWSRACTPYDTNGHIICNYLKQSFPDMTISGSSED